MLLRPLIPACGLQERCHLPSTLPYFLPCAARFVFGNCCCKHLNHCRERGDGEGKEKIWGVRLKIKHRCHLLLSWYRQLRYRGKPGCTAAGTVLHSFPANEEENQNFPSAPSQHELLSPLSHRCNCGAAFLLPGWEKEKLHPLPQG